MWPPLVEVSFYSQFIFNQGDTILHVAAGSGDVVSVKWTLDDYPELKDRRNAKNYTALHFAALSGHVDVLKLLEDHGMKAIEADEVEGGE